MIFLSMTGASKEDVVLDWVLCIYYLLYFWKDTSNIRVLINSGNKINAIISVFAFKLGLKWGHTKVGV